jgi:hypothetical protein
MIEPFRQDRCGFLSALLVRVAEITWHDFVEWIDGRHGTSRMRRVPKRWRMRTIEMPPVDVNQTLADHYEVDRDFLYTRTMLWDMEVRKKPTAGRYVREPGRPSSTSRTLSPGPKSAR